MASTILFAQDAWGHIESNEYLESEMQELFETHERVALARGEQVTQIIHGQRVRWISATAICTKALEAGR